MSTTRIWVLAGSLVIVMVLALGGLLGVVPQLDAAQQSRSDTEAVEALNLQHAATLAALKDDFTRIDETTAKVAELRASVPATDNLDAFTGEIAALASAHGVTVSSYAPQDAAMFTPSPNTAALVPATINNTNFATISFSVSVAGTREAGLAFVAGLQSGERLALLSAINVSPVEEGVTTVTVTGLVYMLLATPYVAPSAEAPAAEATAAE